MRRLFLDLFGDDNIDYTKLTRNLIVMYNECLSNPYRANLVRTYYYDGIADPKDDADAYAKHREYFEALESTQNLDVTLGEAVKTQDGSFRQKGVDILLTIDAIVMAYQDIYESGLFFLGDRDFIPLVDAVKNVGKKTFGFFYDKQVSQELSTSFDFRFTFDKKIMEGWRKVKG